MTAGDARRERIVERLRSAGAPVSGGTLAELCGVSRQVVVTDVALLRSRGERIVSTNRGYVLEGGPEAGRPTRLFKCHHSVEQTADELTCIVDLGGRVGDVMVNHRVYGRLSSRLDVGSRRDVERFMAQLATGASAPLMQVTSGYHFHHVSAGSEDVLDEVGRALEERGYLASLSDFERATFA